MKKSLILLSALLISGCETFNNSSRDDYYARKQYDLVKGQEQQAAQLSATVASLSANNAEIIRYINDINQKIAALQQNDTNIQGSLNSLRQDIDTTKKTWKNSNEKMIEQISSEINNAARSAAAAPSQGPAGSGEFYEHKVETGSTLNAIAKAYRVSISEIKAANKMNNDLIRVGQILYIPKK
jgi:LysM repeat protein